MSRDEEVWKCFSGFWKALTPFTVRPELLLRKTSPKYGESSLPKEVYIVRICSTFLIWYYHFWPLLSIAKCNVLPSWINIQEGAKLEKVLIHLYRDYDCSVFLFILMLRKPINIFMWEWTWLRILIYVFAGPQSILMHH